MQRLMSKFKSDAFCIFVNLWVSRAWTEFLFAKSKFSDVIVGTIGIKKIKHDLICYVKSVAHPGIRREK